MEPSQNLLDQTIAAAKADEQTVYSDGSPAIEGVKDVSFRNSITHLDDRGSVTEMYDKRWEWSEDPVNFVYNFTIRPGMVKGWGLHQHHEDRYFLLRGELELVLYDVRPTSESYGVIQKIYLSEHQPRLVSIPRNVWHADHNIGSKEVLVVNFPTIMYNHAAPDKLRLPLNTDLIPYDFGNKSGW